VERRGTNWKDQKDPIAIRSGCLQKSVLSLGTNPEEHLAEVEEGARGEHLHANLIKELNTISLKKRL
jgi:hypothetical protein